MIRVLWKMWVKFYFLIFFPNYIILIFTIILTSTAFYGESTVETKCLWLDFYVKFILQCFSIIMFFHNIIKGKKVVLLTPYIHVGLVKTFTSYDMHTSSTSADTIPCEIHQYNMIFFKVSLISIFWPLDNTIFNVIIFFK